MTMTTERTRMARRMLPGLLTRIVVPLAGYAVLRPFVGSDAVALAVAAAVPTVWTIGSLLVRRKLDPFGVLGMAGFGVSLLLLWLTGGSAIAVKLGEPVVTGLLGVACLVSVVVGKPAYALLMRATGRPATGGAGTVTVIIGTLLAVHAAVLVLLAFVLSTTDYLAIGRPVGWGVLAIGIAVLFWYRRRFMAHPRRDA
ncbi:MAG TPA: VC0807 family protein [Pseudonocardiaceae bacterium]|nr:VC0807 family protein [Pseudonocardiaceae bacterium]